MTGRICLRGMIYITMSAAVSLLAILSGAYGQGNVEALESELHINREANEYVRERFERHDRIVAVSTLFGQLLFTETVCQLRINHLALAQIVDQALLSQADIVPGSELLKRAYATADQLKTTNAKHPFQQWCRAMTALYGPSGTKHADLLKFQ